MAWWFVRQPNGRLARFSAAADQLTHMNLTEALQRIAEVHGRGTAVVARVRGEAAVA